MAPATTELIDEMHVAMARFEAEANRFHRKSVPCVVCRRRADDFIEATKRAVAALRDEPDDNRGHMIGRDGRMGCTSK